MRDGGTPRRSWIIAGGEGSGRWSDGSRFRDRAFGVAAWWMVRQSGGADCGSPPRPGAPVG